MTHEREDLGLVHWMKAAKLLGLRPAVFRSYIATGHVIYTKRDGVLVIRKAMLPLIMESIMEARDHRPFDLGKREVGEKLW